MKCNLYYDAKNTQKKKYQEEEKRILYEPWQKWHYQKSVTIPALERKRNWQIHTRSKKIIIENFSSGFIVKAPYVTSISYLII